MRSYRPRIAMPSSASTSSNTGKITGLSCSMPMESVSATSTSLKRSTTRPGKPSASLNSTRQQLASAPITVLRYCHAHATLRFQNARSNVSFALRVIKRMRILLFCDNRPVPKYDPLRFTTSTRLPLGTLSPCPGAPSMNSTSASYTHGCPLASACSPFGVIVARGYGR